MNIDEPIPFYVMLEGVTAIELIKLIHNYVFDNGVELTHITNHDAVYFRSVSVTGDQIYMFAGVGWSSEFKGNGYDKLSKQEALKIMYWE